MKFGQLPYLLRQGLLNIINNRVVHLIGIVTMVVSMLIFGTFLILFVNLNTWLHGIGSSLSMSVYLQDEISEQNKNNIKDFLSELPNVEIKRFISKETALKELKRSLRTHSDLLGGLSSNPLPASFELVFKKIKDQKIQPQKIKEEILKMEGVEDVQYSDEWLKRLEVIMNTVELIGFIIAGLLCMGILLIVTNTIKLTIYSRKEEIEIMKLVGATDWFIKIPFLIEGTLQGILSGILALATLFSGYILISSKNMGILAFALLDFTFLPQEYLFLIFFISTALGFIGSFIATGRFISIERFFSV